MEESFRCLIEVLSGIWLVGLVETSKDSPCPGRASNGAPRE
jgi:hypothetical protein